jgi:hypothetical protein
MRSVMLLVVVVACSRTADPSAEPAHHEDRHEPAAAASKRKLSVTVAGAAATWDDATFASVPKLAGHASDGEARDTWSLRELVQRNVGPGARVTAVINRGGKTPIEAADWDDTTRTPILHTTRRGSLKFRWANKDGHWGETVVKDVTGLEIAR